MTAKKTKKPLKAVMQDDTKSTLNGFPNYAYLQSKREALLPELQPFVAREVMYEKFMHVLRHPLLIMDLDTIPPSPTGNNNATCNFLYRNRKAASEKARAEKEWLLFILYHERPYQIMALANIAHELADREYWELLGQVYMESENIFQQKGRIAKLLASQRRHRHCIMSKSEQRVLRAMPEKLTIYRGCKNSTNSKQGWSWTLDRGKATLFANRISFSNHRRPLVLTATADKKNVIAYFNGRKEKEILINPKHVTVIEEADTKKARNA